MTETLSAIAAPLGGAASSVTKPGKSLGRKLKTGAILASPIAALGLLCVVDVQTAGAQKPAECTSAQQAVIVPKPHIWLAGSITGAADKPTALRDVMAATHPELALTAVIAANPSLGLSAMGNVPPTYGGRACLILPSAGTAKSARRADPKAPRQP